NTVVVKQDNDVTRLQALVDKKKVVIIEAAIKEVLRLDDAKGVDCLPNEEIFVELARMGYEKHPQSSHSIKPSFKASGRLPGTNLAQQWLFENMLEVREVDAEEEVQVPTQDDVDQENIIKEIADDVAQPTSPLPPSPVKPSSPLYRSPRPPQPQATEGSSLLVQQVLDKCSAFVLRVEGLETANTAQQLEILKLKARVKKLERLNKVKSSKLRHHSSKVLSMQEDDAEVQEAVEIVTTAKLMTEVVTAATTQVVAASTPIPAAKPAIVDVSIPISAAKPAAKPKVLKIVAAAPAVSTRKRKEIIIRDPEEELHNDTPAETLSMKDKGKGILVEDPKPMKKKDQIEMDAEYARKLQEEEESHVQAKDVQPKGIQYIKRYHGYKKKPQSESKACKNMIAYLKNTKRFKMAFFKGKTYDQIRLIFQARFDAN
nr:hypothetical protein [Tanacetum cinerariifolium]